MAVCLLLIVAWMAVIALGARSRYANGLEEDELQHLHMAWRIGQGDLPYRDFFEHHPPLMHFVIAPFVASYRRFSDVPLTALRAIEAVLLVLLFGILYRLLRRQMPSVVAAWGAGLFLLGRFTYSYFELRPDWWALLFLVVIIGLLTDSAKAASIVPAIVSGILAGACICLTQKSWVFILIIAAWLGLIMIAAPAGSRKMRMLRLIAFGLASLIMPASMIGCFAAHGATAVLVRDNLWLNLHWPREQSFPGYIVAEAQTSAGVIAISLVTAWALLRDVRRQLIEATSEGLVTAIFLIGWLAYCRTPMPYEQSYLFFVGFWSAWMTVIAVWSFMSTGQFLGMRLKTAIVMVVILLLVLLAGQKDLGSALIIVVGSGILLAAFVLLIHHHIAPRAALMLFVVTGTWLTVRDAIDVIKKDDYADQRTSSEALDNLLGPDEAIITLWPPALPFRRHVGQFPFAYEAVLQQFAPAIQAEYLAAIAKHETRIAVGLNPPYQKFMPTFAGKLDSSFSPLNIPGTDAMIARPPAAAH